jgi:hypothetical protein
MPYTQEDLELAKKIIQDETNSEEIDMEEAKKLAQKLAILRYK